MTNKELAQKLLTSIDAKYGYGNAKECDRNSLWLHVNWLSVHYEFESYAELIRWVRRIKKENKIR